MNCRKLCCLLLLAIPGTPGAGSAQHDAASGASFGPSSFQLARPYFLWRPSYAQQFTRVPGTFLNSDKYLHPEEHFQKNFMKDFQPYARSYVKYEGYKKRLMDMYKQSYSNTWEGAAFMGGMGALLYLLDPSEGLGGSKP